MEDVPQCFAQPFTFAGGAAATVDQESDADITACVVNLLRTERGWLDWLPAYGRPDWSFTLGELDVSRVHALVLTWEDRATPQITRQAMTQVLQEFHVDEVTANG